jgi:hypothetical protein
LRVGPLKDGIGTEWRSSSKETWRSQAAEPFRDGTPGSFRLAGEMEIVGIPSDGNRCLRTLHDVANNADTLIVPRIAVGLSSEKLKS